MVLEPLRSDLERFRQRRLLPCPFQRPGWRPRPNYIITPFGLPLLSYCDWGWSFRPPVQPGEGRIHD